MYQKFIRFVVAFFGSGVLVGLAALVASVMRALAIYDIATQWSTTGVVIYYAIAGLFGLILFYIIEPKLYRLTAGIFKRIESRLKQIPTKDIVLAIIGLIIGLVIAALLSGLIGLIPIQAISLPLSVLVYIALGYLGVTVAISKRSEVNIPKVSNIPLVEPRPVQTEQADPPKGKAAVYKDAKFAPPKIIDTSAIIDGRILDVARTGILEGKLVIPGFVLGELRHIADSADNLRRQRGRRGLDILAEMQKELPHVVVMEKDYENMEVDEKLIRLAKEQKGKIITNDYNLNKVAKVKGVGVININQLVKALKPAVLPGEQFEIQIIKDGKEHKQGVGYLDDGTMVVVDGGKGKAGQQMHVTVTSVVQTSAGRMIFAKTDEA